MDPFVFQNKGITRVDIVVVLDKKLAFLADRMPLRDTKTQPGLFIWGKVEEKSVLFFFRADPKALEAAKSLGARSALMVQTVRSVNPQLEQGAVLLLDAQDGVYDTSLLVHLGPGFGVKKGYCVESPKEATGMRLLGFRLVAEDARKDGALMGDIIEHLLACKTADL